MRIPFARQFVRDYQAVVRQLTTQGLEPTIARTLAGIASLGAEPLKMACTLVEKFRQVEEMVKRSHPQVGRSRGVGRMSRHGPDRHYATCIANCDRIVTVIGRIDPHRARRVANQAFRSDEPIKWAKRCHRQPSVDYDDSLSGVSLIEVDRDGIIVATTPLDAQLYDPALIVHGQGSLHGLDALTGQPTELATQEYIEVAVLDTPANGLKLDCVPPPPSPNHKSLVAGTSSVPAVYTYEFAGSWAVSDWTHLPPRQQGIVDGFNAWNTANHDPSREPLNVVFAPYTSATSTPPPPQASIQLKNEFVIARDRDGHTIYPGGSFAPLPTQVLSNGHIVGGEMKFTTKEDVINDYNGYYKVALHEIGHTLALWHTNRNSGLSVMNELGGQNDRQRNIPKVPTSCDVQAAFDYSTR